MSTHARADALFDALAHRYRRYILRYLTECDTATLDALAATIQKQDEPQQSRQRIRTGLYHRHLPRLAGANLINYDAGADTIELASGTHGEVTDLLAVTTPEQPQDETATSQQQQVPRQERD